MIPEPTTRGRCLSGLKIKLRNLVWVFLLVVSYFIFRIILPDFPSFFAANPLEHSNVFSFPPTILIISLSNPPLVSDPPPLRVSASLERIIRDTSNYAPPLNPSVVRNEN